MELSWPHGHKSGMVLVLICYTFPAPTVSSLSNSFQTPLAFPDAGLTPKPDSSLIPIVPVTSAALPSWKDYSAQAGSSSVKKGSIVAMGLI